MSQPSLPCTHHTGSYGLHQESRKPGWCMVVSIAVQMRDPLRFFWSLISDILVTYYLMTSTVDRSFQEPWAYGDLNYRYRPRWRQSDLTVYSAPTVFRWFPTETDITEFPYGNLFVVLASEFLKRIHKAIIWKWSEEFLKAFQIPEFLKRT